VFRNVESASKSSSQRKLLWLAKKNMVISSLVLGDEFYFEPEKWDMFLQRTGRYLRTFELRVLYCAEVEAIVGPLSQHANNISSILIENCATGNRQISKLIAANAHLKSLELRGHFNLKEEHLEGMQCSLQRLQIMHGGFNDQNLLALIQGGCMLQLELSACHRITTEGFEEIAARCPTLRSLGLSHTSLNNTALKAIAHSCPLIVHLDVSHCDQITDSGLICAVRMLKLRSLSFAWSNGISSEIMPEIATHCADTLTTFYSCALSDFTALRTVQHLDKCTKLRTLSVFTAPSDVRHFDTIFSGDTMKRVTSLTVDMFGINCEMLSSIGSYCLQLQELCLTQDVYECTPRYTPQSLQLLLDRLTYLRLLVVHKDAYIPSFVAHWMKLYPHVKCTIMNSMLYRVLEMDL